LSDQWCEKDMIVLLVWDKFWGIHKHTCNLKTNIHIYVCIIDQVQGQDGWILAEFSLYVFMDRDKVKVHKNTKRKRGQYPAILTTLVWSIKDLLYGTKSTEKNDLCTCLFSSSEKETIWMLKWWRVPLYPDWINAENTIIWLVTFQIQISKLSNSKQTFVFAGFCCKTYF